MSSVLLLSLLLSLCAAWTTKHHTTNPYTYYYYTSTVAPPMPPLTSAAPQATTAPPPPATTISTSAPTGAPPPGAPPPGAPPPGPPPTTATSAQTPPPASSGPAPTGHAGGLSCLDQNGNPVDFYVGLKHARKTSISFFNAQSGKFDIEQTLDAKSGNVQNTLNAMYARASSLSYLMINDEAPDGTQLDQAHQKGVVAFDDYQGFYLVHSAPNFPATVATWKTSGYAYPGPEILYGQSFMCITIPISQMDTLMQAFYIDNSQVYDSNLLPQHAKLVPTMQSVINNLSQSKATATSFNFTSVGGKAWTIFAKNKAWYNELYEALVAPTFKDGLFVESWVNGVGTIASVCSPYKVLELAELTLPDGVSWKINEDHAKWCITQTLNWACVGDINRQHGQFSRGGGQVCTNDATLWGAFKQVISNVQACT